MKRKRGNMKRQKIPLMVGANANQTGLDNFDHAEFESRVKFASPQASTNVSCWQVDLEKIVDKITDDNAKKAVNMGTKSSRGVGASSVNLIGSAALLQNERTHQEPQRLLDKYPRYNEQELNDALLVIKTIMKMDEAEPFNIPVNPIALGVHDYFDVIDTPMDFGAICNNLEKGLKYKNSEDVFKDVQYIWENCCKYNKKGDYILELMEQVKMNFMNHWITAGLYQDPAYREKILNDSLGVIKKIMKMDEAEPFNIPVNPIALGIHDYFDVVDTPMDFGTICHNLEKGLKYKDSEDVFKDVQYIWENCCKYNKKGDYILELMERVKMNFMNHWVIAGLYSKQSQTINGSLHLPPRAGSTMRLSKRGQESPVGPGGDNPGQQQVDQMGPIRVRSHQHLPISQSHQCQTNSNQQLPSLQQTDANIGTADFTIKQRMPGGHRVYIAANELGEPIGLEAPKLTNFLGAMAQDGFMAPLTYADWRVMPDANKEKMWQQVELKFDIDPKCKSWVMKSLGKKWKDWKTKLKATHFHTHTTNEERLADCDEKVIPDQWSILVQYWNLEEVEERSAKNKASHTQQKLYGTTGTKSSVLVREEQERSDKNKASGAQQKLYDTTGTKSFARVREEQAKKLPEGKEPSQAELEQYRFTCARKDGQPIDEVSPTIIPQLHEQTTQQQETLENSRRPQDDILPQVKGKDRHVDPKPIRAEAIRVVSGANVEVREMKQRMLTMEQTCAQMASQMAAMMSMMSSIHKTPPNKHLPNVADTSDGLPEQQVRPSTPRTVASLLKASAMNRGKIQTASKSKANP